MTDTIHIARYGTVENCEYLGDGVYFGTNANGYVLFCHDGVEAYEKVYLEQEVMNKLLAHYGKLYQIIQGD